MLINKNSLTSQIYKEIKNDILTNRLKLGAEISINEIAMKYKVSYTPAREAIKSLIKDGLVIGATNKVHKIVNPTGKELFEFMEIRKMCECYAVKKIIENLGQNEIKNIENQITILKFLEKNKVNTIRDFYLTDIDFHLNLVKSSNNLKLLEIYKKISNIVNIMIYKIDDRKEIVDVFFKQHFEILETILNKNSLEANKKLTHHIEYSFKYYQDNYL